MADIELVIKIPEKTYNALTHTEFDASLVVNEMRKLIANGTPLPKGHGRLKDVDDLDTTTITTDDYSGNEILDVILKEDLDNAQTIIEADGEHKDRLCLSDSKWSAPLRDPERKEEEIEI